MRRIHELKTKPVYYEQVRLRRKTAEVRFNDRDFRIGDLVELFPWSEALNRRLSENSVVREITFILTSEEGPWLTEGHVMLCFGDPA